jgi:hypothetical protein
VQVVVETKLVSGFSLATGVTLVASVLVWLVVVSARLVLRHYGSRSKFSLVLIFFLIKYFLSVFHHIFRLAAKSQLDLIRTPFCIWEWGGGAPIKLGFQYTIYQF